MYVCKRISVTDFMSLEGEWTEQKKNNNVSIKRVKQKMCYELNPPTALTTATTQIISKILQHNVGILHTFLCWNAHLCVCDRYLHIYTYILVHKCFSKAAWEWQL